MDPTTRHGGSADLVNEQFTPDGAPPSAGTVPGLRRLSEDECWDFLARHHLGRVALVQYQRPMIYPVNYVVDDRSIVFRSGPGAKLVAAGLGQVTAFEVDETDEIAERGTSVVVHGRLEEVVGHEEQARTNRSRLRSWAPGRREHLVRVVAERTTGRQIPGHHDDVGVGADCG